MKLYYNAGSCSTSCHITLEEAGIPYEAISVDWDNESDPNIALVGRLNPVGTLPVAVMDQGKVLSQNIAIHTYVADQVPEKNLLPKPGTFERTEAMNWLSFVASDLHKGFTPLFAATQMANNPEAQAEIRNYAVSNLQTYFKLMEHALADRPYLTGKNFTVIDAYCFVVTSWTKWVNVSLDAYPNIKAYLGRVAQRPAVQKVLKEEGLLE